MLATYIDVSACLTMKTTMDIMAISCGRGEDCARVQHVRLRWSPAAGSGMATVLCPRTTRAPTYAGTRQAIATPLPLVLYVLLPRRHMPCACLPVYVLQDYINTADYPLLAVFNIQHHLRMGLAGAIMLVAPTQVRRRHPCRYTHDGAATSCA
jgi:hypothetical protein